MDTDTFDKRILYGKTAEQAFVSWLIQKDYFYFRTGQEFWMPKWVHEKLRFVFDDGIKMICHFPDFAVYAKGNQFLAQVKAAPNSKDYPTLTIEKNSFDCSMNLFKLKLPVMLIWQVEDGELFAQWIDKVNPETPAIDRTKTNGSHTPQYNIRKHELIKLDEILSHA